MHPFGEREYIMFTAPAPAYVDICIWRESLFPLQLEFLPLVGGDWSLKLAVCGEVGQTFSPLLLNPDLFFYTWILMQYLNTPTSVSLE